MPKPKLSFIPNYKKGIQYLGIAFLLLVLASYQFNISKTIDTWNSNTNYKNRLKASQNATYEQEVLKEQLKQLETHSIKAYDRDRLIGFISDFCKRNNLLITNLPSTDHNQKGGVNYITNVIEVEGEYKGMVQLAYELEHKEMLGSVISFQFNQVEDRVSRKTFLRGKLILRNIQS